MHIKHPRLSNALLASAAVAWAIMGQSQAQAQQANVALQSADENEAGGVETIVVTAQKRAQNIQDVPISMVAVDGDMMVRAGVSTLDSLQHYAPGLTISTVGAGFVSYTYLRGAGTNQVDPGSDPSVAFFIDEVYIGGTAGLQFDLLDIDRVEVLKGPQGTLFGRNAAAGAISITTKRPGRNLGSSFNGTLGNYANYSARGSVTGPLVDTGELRFRLSAAYKHGAGFTENLAGGPRPGRLSTLAGRAQLEWAGADTSFLLTLDGLRARNGMTNQFISSASKAGLLNAAAAAALPPGETFYRHYYDVDGFERQDLIGVTGRFEWSTPIGELTSISAYRHNRFVRNQDQDATIFNSFRLDSAERDDTFSQEVRLANEDKGSAFNWLFGLYYYHGRVISDFAARTGPFFPSPAAASKVGNDISRITTDSYAAFGQLSWDLTDQLNITVGGRYTEDHKMDIRSVKGFLATAAFDVAPSAKWGAFTPAITLNYHITSDVLAYASYRRGFKSGGFQTVLPATAAIAATPFEPEKVDAYEIGLKSSWWHDRVVLNAALFRSDITNQQILRITGTAAQTIDNAGATRTDGIDLSLALRPIPALRLNADLTYQHARFQRYLNGAVSFAGNTQLRSPDFTGSFSGDYDFDLGSAGQLTARGEYSRRSRAFFDAANTALPGLFQKAYGLGNAFVTYRPERGNWDVALWVKNIGDTRYYRNITLSGPTGLSVPGDPRTYGVSLHIAMGS
jgi:iron complex outermembrane receptor protein